jgi:pyruvate formate lyase activating enzyme
MQPDFLLACLRLCSERGMHTAVDTCGYAPAEAFLRVLPFTGLFLYDLKIMDPQRHEAIVGVGNAGILDNLRLIHAHDARIHVRIPLVPGITDSEENLSAAGAFVRDELDAEPPVHILPYHAMAQEKYRRRGLEPAIIDEPDAGAVAKARGVLEAHGLKVFVGG